MFIRRKILSNTQSFTWFLNLRRYIGNSFQANKRGVSLKNWEFLLLKHVNIRAFILVPVYRKVSVPNCLHTTHAPNWFQPGKGAWGPRGAMASQRSQADHYRGCWTLPADNCHMYVTWRMCFAPISLFAEAEWKPTATTFHLIFSPNLQFIHGKILAGNLLGFRTGRTERQTAYSRKKCNKATSSTGE